MKRSAAFIFGLFLASFVGAARASEVVFTCDYEFGTETDTKRRKTGSVAIAIDVAAKTARINFGEGWFKTMSLVVDGTDVKETAPPASGEELGFFYFDLTENSGGFASASAPHEFFDGCVRVDVNTLAATQPPAAEFPAPNPAGKIEAPRTAAAPAETKTQAPPPADAQASTEYHGDATARKNPAPASQAVIDPATKKETAQTPAAPASAPAPASVPANAPPPTPAGAQPSAGSAAAPSQVVTAAPSAATDAAPPPAGERPATEPQADVGSREIHPSTPEAPVSPPAFENAAPQSPAAPAPAAASPPPPAGDQATTVPHADTATREVPAPASQAINLAPDKSASPPASSAAVSEPGAVGAQCGDKLRTEAQAIKLNFANSSFNIDADDRPGLRRIAKLVKDCGNVAVEVSGHTDNLGASAENKMLSQLRANAVVNFLIAQGVASSNLKAVGYGQEQPIATNATSEGRRLNRRVEFRVSAH